MKKMIMRTWNRGNRTSILKNILVQLNQTGNAEGDYSQGRSYVRTLLLGKGNPTHMGENDEWNQVRVRYQGKDAFILFDSEMGPIGQFFDWKFDEREIQQLESAFAQNGISVHDAHVWGIRPLVLLIEVILPFWLFILLYGVFSHDMTAMAAGYINALCSLILLLLLLRK